MDNDLPHITPHVSPLTVASHVRATTGAPRAAVVASVKRRPVRGVVTLPAPNGGSGYVSPIYPDGIRSNDLRGKPPEHQAAVALHWFSINFITREQDEQNRSSVLGVGVLGQMVLGSGEPVTFNGEPVTIGGVADSDEGRKVAETSLASLTTARAELGTEFSEAIQPEIVSVVAAHFEQQSAEWVFVPLPNLLPIELDDVGRLQSKVDAAVVHRDAQALEVHLEAIPSTPSNHGRNYWPGAELLDEGLRTDLKEIARDLRKLADDRATVAPVEKAVGRLSRVRNTVAQWLAEGFVKNLAGSMLPAALYWWHTLFDLLTQLLHSAEAWVSSLIGG